MVERERLLLPDPELSRSALVLAQRFVQRWDLHARQMGDGSFYTADGSRLAHVTKLPSSPPVRLLQAFNLKAPASEPVGHLVPHHQKLSSSVRKAQQRHL
jgi:hypothetical protein